MGLVRREPAVARNVRGKIKGSTDVIALVDLFRPSWPSHSCHYRRWPFLLCRHILYEDKEVFTITAPTTQVRVWLHLWQSSTAEPLRVILDSATKTARVSLAPTQRSGTAATAPKLLNRGPPPDCQKDACGHLHHPPCQSARLLRPECVS